MREGSRLLLHNLDQILEPAYRVIFRHEVQGFLGQRDVREAVGDVAGVLVSVLDL